MGQRDGYASVHLMQAKILIVGGGVTGTALALRASQRTDPLKEPVVLLEQAEIGAGSSGGSGAILRQFYADRLLSLMARDSLRHFAEFERRTGRSIGFARTGVLTLTGPEQRDWHDRIASIVSDRQEHGVALEQVDAERMRALLPGLEVRDGSVGVWEPDAATVDPHKTLEAFAALARTHGAVTRLGVQVERLLVEDGAVTGAETSEGTVHAGQVVVAGGPWTGELLARSGIDLPLRAIVPENVFVAMPQSEQVLEAAEAAAEGNLAERLATDELVLDTPATTSPVLIDLDHAFYARPDPAHARMRVGRIDYEEDAVLERADDKPDAVRPHLHDWGRDKLTGRLPAYAGRPTVHEETSWYTLTPDGQPMIGPVDGVRGLFVAAGFSGHGFKLAPSVADGLVQMLFDEPVTAFDEAFFSPARFEGPADAWSGRFGL